jgi:hypothetical protein
MAWIGEQRNAETPTPGTPPHEIGHLCCARPTPPGGDPPDFPETPQGACGRGQPPERAAENKRVRLFYQRFFRCANVQRASSRSTHQTRGQPVPRGNGRTMQKKEPRLGLGIARALDPLSPSYAGDWRQRSAIRLIAFAEVVESPPTRLKNKEPWGFDQGSRPTAAPMCGSPAAAVTG